MKIEIEIGQNLKEAIDAIVENADRRRVDAGLQVQAAFGLNFTEAVIHLGAHEQAIKNGLNVTIESKKTE